jgi:hypothetical protein
VAISTCNDVSRVAEAAPPWTYDELSGAVDPLLRGEPAQRSVTARCTCCGLRVAVILLLAVVWSAVTCWYLLFGLLLVPYRLIRRGDRNRHRTELRHREILAAAQAQASWPPDSHSRNCCRPGSRPAKGGNAP